MLIELKGAAYNTDTINWLWAEALEAGMVDHFALYVVDDQQPVSIAQQTHWQGQLIRGFRVSPTVCYLVAVCACMLSNGCMLWKHGPVLLARSCPTAVCTNKSAATQLTTKPHCAAQP